MANPYPLLPRTTVTLLTFSFLRKRNDGIYMLISTIIDTATPAAEHTLNPQPEANRQLCHPQPWEVVHYQEVRRLWKHGNDAHPLIIS
jgi:hypothetical protein